MKINSISELKAFLSDKMPGNYPIKSDKGYLIKDFIYKIISSWMQNNGYTKADIDANEFPILYISDFNNANNGEIVIKTDIKPMLSDGKNDRIGLKMDILKLEKGSIYHYIPPITLNEMQKKSDRLTVKQICYMLRPGELNCLETSSGAVEIRVKDSGINTRNEAFALLNKVTHDTTMHYETKDETMKTLYRQYMYAYNKEFGKNIKAQMLPGKITFYIHTEESTRERNISDIKKLMPKTIELFQKVNESGSYTCSETRFNEALKELHQIENLLRGRIRSAIKQV